MQSESCGMLAVNWQKCYIYFTDINKKRIAVFCMAGSVVQGRAGCGGIDHV